MIYKAAKFSSLLIAVIAIPFCFQMDFILELWLKIVPPSASIFCQLLLVSACLNILRTPLMIGIHATGRIKRMSFVTGTCYLVGVLIVWIGYRYGLPVEFAYVVTLIINLLLIVVVAILLKSLIAQFNYGDYFKKSILPFLIVVSASFLAIKLVMFSVVNLGIILQISQLVFNITLCSLLVFLFGINREERNQFVRLAKEKINQIKH